MLNYTFKPCENIHKGDLIIFASKENRLDNGNTKFATLSEFKFGPGLIKEINLNQTPANYIISWIMETKGRFF